MEEEIPEALYLLNMISERSLHQNEPNLLYSKFVATAFLRVCFGYFFILNMFVVVVQATGVIDIFFDVLALQFLQQVDGIAFRLAKMDVFGKHIKRASTRKCFRVEFEKLPFARVSTVRAIDLSYSFVSSKNLHSPSILFSHRERRCQSLSRLCTSLTFAAYYQG